MKCTVTIIESERGWGQRVDDVKDFDSMDAAWDFVNKFNEGNNKDVVPDWYMRASDPVPVR